MRQFAKTSTVVVFVALFCVSNVSVISLILNLFLLFLKKYHCSKYVYYELLSSITLY